MTSKRLHIIFVAIIVLMFASLLGGAYAINSVLTKKGQQLTNLKAQTKALEQEQIGLKKAKKQIAQYAELQKITKAIVPQDKSQAEAVRELVNIAAKNGITLASIAFPSSTLGTGTSVKPGTPTSAAPAPSASSQNTTTNNLSQLQPVPNIPGVYLLEINVQNDEKRPIAYRQFINFLDDLEHNRRTAQVSGIAIQPDKKNTSLLTFTLTLNEYIKP